MDEARSLEKSEKWATREKEINMSDERTGSQQNISKQMLEKRVNCYSRKKKESGASNTQTVRERIPADRNGILSVYGWCAQYYPGHISQMCLFSADITQRLKDT